MLTTLLATAMAKRRSRTTTTMSAVRSCSSVRRRFVERISARATLRMKSTIARISVLLKIDTASWTDVNSSPWNSVTEPNVGGSVTPSADPSDATAWLGTVSGVIVGSVI